MLEIVRGRPWSAPHTVYDNEDGPLADLSHLVEYRCQIREKTATRNRKGFFEHRLVTDVAVEELQSIITLSLTVEQTALLQTGEYQIDLIGIAIDSSVESLLDPEPIRVVNRPTVL